MKKIITVLALVTSMFSAQAFAADDGKVTREAREAFKREFPEATYPKWEKVEGTDLYMVRFYFESQGYVAYLDVDGELIGSARLVGKDNLPFKVGQVIRQKYDDSEIMKIEELTMGGSLSYLFTLNYKGSRMLLRVYSDGHVQKIKSEKNKDGKGF